MKLFIWDETDIGQFYVQPIAVAENIEDAKMLIYQKALYEHPPTISKSNSMPSKILELLNSACYRSFDLTKETWCKTFLTNVP